jgi:predicted GNAT family N-acyltransferase
VQQSLHFDTLKELHRFLQQRGTVFVSSKSSDDGNSSSINSNDTAATIEHLLIDCRQSQLMLQQQNP